MTDRCFQCERSSETARKGGLFTSLFIQPPSALPKRADARKIHFLKSSKFIQSMEKPFDES